MKVTIKSIGNELDLKNTGLEIAVYRFSKKPYEHIGDLYVRKSGLVWCPGKAEPDGSGIPVSWKKFIKWMERAKGRKK